MLELLYPNCAGLDVHKKFVVVCCLWGDPQGQSHKELRKFTTLTEDIQALKVWLQEKGVTHVAMESTGVYWQPIHNILEDHFKLLLVNAQAVKRMPGRKTDMKDAEWLATLLQHGLLQPSFIPNREQRELRELTRYRMSLIQERTRFTQRLEKVLEGTNLKLSSVVSDLKGVSAQAILRAMIQGEQDPQVLAELAKGQLRNKRELLERTLVGHLSEHQRFFLKDLLVHLDFLDEQITQLEERIQAKLNQMPPFQQAVTLLDTIPAVIPPLATLIVAEMRVDRHRFPSDRHLTAWAGVAPGNNETGGKQRPAKSRQGNRYLQIALVLAAHAASRQKGSYLRSLYYRLAHHRGKSRAAVAVGRTILHAAYHMILKGETFHDLGEYYLDQLDRDRTAKRLLMRLQALGYQIVVKEQIPAGAETSMDTPSVLPLVT